MEIVVAYEIILNHCHITAGPQEHSVVVAREFITRYEVVVAFHVNSELVVIKTVVAYGVRKAVFYPDTGITVVNVVIDEADAAAFLDVNASGEIMYVAILYC